MNPIVLAYVLLAIGVLGNNGAFFPLLLPLVLCAWWLVFGVVRGTAPRPIPGNALAVLLAAQWLLAGVRPPGESPRPWPLVALYFLVTLALLAVAVRACRARGPARPGVFAAMLGLYLLAGWLNLRICPQPHIDVFVIQQQGARDLLAGRDPYLSIFPNIYDPGDTGKYFGAQVPALTHYPYPPLSLLVTTLGLLLGGDVRVAMLCLQALTGALLVLLARRHAPAPAPGAAAIDAGLLGLYLLHPRGLYVLEQSWTEPLVCAAFVGLLLVLPPLASPPGLAGRPPPSGEATVVAWSRARTWGAGALLGAFLSAKQYGVLLLPLLVPALPRRARLPVLAVGAGLWGVIALPLLLWDARGFWEDVVLFQLHQPFRIDALSLPAGVAWLTGWRAPGALALLGALAAYGWLRAGRRLPPGVPGLALGAAFVFFSFFLMAKQAFCNYYYFVGVLLLCAVATGAGVPRPDLRLDALDSPHPEEP